MIEVEQRGLRAFEEHALAVAQRTVDEQGRVRDVGPQPLRVALGARDDLLQVERCRAVDALEPDVLLGERDLDLLAQDLGVEQVLHSDAEPRRLVRVGRADAPPGRADLQVPEPSLAGAVDRDVPRHDQVRVPGDPHRVGRDAARLEIVELLDEDPRVDHAPGAEDALLAPEDPRGHVLELVRLAVRDDRVPGVRPTLVAADEIRMLRQQVDDLPLALVPPLGAHDDGGRHGA